MMDDLHKRMETLIRAIDAKLGGHGTLPTVVDLKAEAKAIVAELDVADEHQRAQVLVQSFFGTGGSKDYETFALFILKELRK